MKHAVFTPLAGPEFDNFLFASIGDSGNESLLSVVSALARMDIDPWAEAASLAQMPREQAMERLTSLIASVTKTVSFVRSPEELASRLVELLSRAKAAKIDLPRALHAVGPAWRSRVVVVSGILFVVLAGCFVWTQHSPTGFERASQAPLTTSEPK